MFAVTYEIVTAESAEHGDAEERGFIAKSCSLRDAVRWVGETRTSHVDDRLGVEPSDSDVTASRWITVDNSMEYLTGACESRSLHMPDSLTGATRRRILRLVESGRY